MKFTTGVSFFVVSFSCCRFLGCAALPSAHRPKRPGLPLLLSDPPSYSQARGTNVKNGCFPAPTHGRGEPERPWTPPTARLEYVVHRRVVLAAWIQAIVTSRQLLRGFDQRCCD